MVTGSAPLGAEVLDFMKIAFCCSFLEGYGLTESSASGFCSNDADRKSGHVGGPLQNFKLRLMDLPEMNYLHTTNPPRGEICLWSQTVFTGYFANPEKTAEALIDGWLHTGDVGEV